MSLEKIASEFREGKIDKSSYIKKMHKVHEHLFEYSTYIKGKDIQKIEIMDDVVIITSRANGVKIICDPEDHRIAPIEILNFSDYELQEYSIINKLVNDSDCLFDIGANIGWYSISLSKSKKDLEIHAFEPIPHSYEYLVANTKLNGCSNIHIYNYGLSCKNEDVEFYYYPQGSGNASMKLMNEDVANIRVTSRVERLDDFFVKNDIEKLDFIKCDVEGAEYLVFQGAETVLRKQRPIVFSELLRKWSAKYSYHPNNMIDYFSKLEYGCFVVDNEKLVAVDSVDENTTDTNFFFIPMEKLSSLNDLGLL